MGAIAAIRSNKPTVGSISSLAACAESNTCTLCIHEVVEGYFTSTCVRASDSASPCLPTGTPTASPP